MTIALYTGRIQLNPHTLVCAHLHTRSLLHTTVPLSIVISPQLQCNTILSMHCRHTKNNNITFKRTRSLSNAVCICHQFLKHLACNFDELELGLFKVIQCQMSRYQSVAHGWLPIWLLLTQTSYLWPFLKYLTSNFDDLEQGQFKFLQSQKSRCQSIARGQFHIRLPLTPSWYLSPFSGYLTLKLFSHKIQAESELNRK